MEKTIEERLEALESRTESHGEEIRRFRKLMSRLTHMFKGWRDGTDYYVGTDPDGKW